MATYTFVCQQGHEPETMTVQAEGDDEAMTKMMPLAKDHLAKVHQGGPVMSDEQVMGMIKGGWTKA